MVGGFVGTTVGDDVGTMVGNGVRFAWTVKSSKETVWESGGSTMEIKRVVECWRSNVIETVEPSVGTAMYSPFTTTVTVENPRPRPDPDPPPREATVAWNFTKSTSFKSEMSKFM